MGTETLKGFIEKRRAQNRPTDVLVGGDGRSFPDDVYNVATAVAEVISGPDGEIFETVSGDIGPDDVALIRADTTPTRKQPTRNMRRERLKAKTLRASGYAGLVGWAYQDDILRNYVRSADVKINVDETGIGSVYRVKLDGESREAYFKKMTASIDCDLTTEQEADD